MMKRKSLDQRVKEFIERSGWWPEGTVNDAIARERLSFTYRQAFRAGRRTAKRRRVEQ